MKINDLFAATNYEGNTQNTGNQSKLTL